MRNWLFYLQDLFTSNKNSQTKNITSIVIMTFDLKAIPTKILISFYVFEDCRNYRMQYKKLLKPDVL